MRLFVFAPGILGTRLRQKNPPHAVVWPPGANGVFKTLTHADLTADLAPVDSIDKVCIQKIYSTIFELFKAAGVQKLTTGVQQDALLDFGYDWRQGIELEADRLAVTLDQKTTANDTIVMVGHSMGALLIRFLLEAERYKGHPFLQRVRKFVSINGPLQGAPVMLARAFELEPTSFIEWSQQTEILATPPFSGAYVLFPAPGRKHLFNGKDPIDIYDPHYYKHFGMGAENMVDATRMWAQIAGGKREQAIAYVLMSSLLDGDRTIESISYVDGWKVKLGVGDGKVPPWSSTSIADATRPPAIPGEHRGMIDTPKFRELFDLHIAKLAKEEAKPALALQPLKSQVRPDGLAQFAVIREGLVASEGVISWTPVTAEGKVAGPVELTEKVALLDSEAPVINARTPGRLGSYAVTLSLGGIRVRTAMGVRRISDVPRQEAPEPLA